MQMSLSICINSIITAMEGGGRVVVVGGWHGGGLFYGLRQCYPCQLVEGRAKERWMCVRVLCVGMSAPLEFFSPCERRGEERRGRWLHHLAGASCHTAENLANSIVPLARHRRSPSGRCRHRCRHQHPLWQAVWSARATLRLGGLGWWGGTSSSGGCQDQLINQ